MNNKIKEVYERYEREYDECETQSAPSGEWDEYNIDFLVAQGAFFAVEEMVETIGTCEGCKYYSILNGLDPCFLKHNPKNKDFYCGDYKIKQEGREN